MNAGQQDKAILRLLNKRSVRGKKKLQKLLYFLQEAEGEPLGFDYRMHYYGPYSPTLDSRVRALSHAGLVESSTSGEGTSSFSIAKDVAESLAGRHEPLDEKIGRVDSRLGGQTPNTIELLGTIHFLVSGCGRVDEGRIGTLVDQIRAWKGSKYTRTQIIDGVKRLQEWGYVK